MTFPSTGIPGPGLLLSFWLLLSFDISHNFSFTFSALSFTFVFAFGGLSTSFASSFGTFRGCFLSA